jgi:hypothetical protein
MKLILTRFRLSNRRSVQYIEILVDDSILFQIVEKSFRPWMLE